MNRQSATMRAARIVEPGRADVVEVERPRPGPGEVLIRVEGCGVCGSNLASWEGQLWLSYPAEPGAGGHEAWGTIEDTGPEVARLRPGDRVAAISYRAFAEYDVAPQENVVALPASLAGQPFPGEALACAWNAFERARIEPGQEVAVVGIGFLGALLVQLSSRAGARVIALSRRPFALELASAMGAEEAILLDDLAGARERAKEAIGGRLFERVIECAGVQASLDVAAELTAERGLLVIAGYHQDGPRTVHMQLWNWRGFDVVNAHERSPARYVYGLERAISAVLEGELEPRGLYTHGLPLDELGAALDLLRARPDGFLKAWVSP